MLFNQEFFVCKEFDRDTTDIFKWWLLADNFEGQTLGFVVLYQVYTMAFIGNFGFDYRQKFYKNYFFMTIFVVAIIFTTSLLILEPNVMSCWFRFNCGNDKS